jgi:lysophospholipase
LEILELRSADGTKLNAHRWTPKGTVKAEILLCHGLAEHMGRYDYVADTLTKHGYRVTGIELRGHGHSGGTRGHINKFSEYLDDMQSASDSIGGDHFILAHSMGSLVSLEYLRNSSTHVRGLAVTGLAVGVAVEAPVWKTAGARILSRVLPKLSLFNEIDPTTVCSDPAVVEAYVADPLVYNTITPRWYRQFLATIDRVQQHAASYKTPMLAMWGTEDVLVSLPDIQRFVASYGGSIESKSWEGLRHEILNEPQRDEILNHLLKWLELHCD